MKEILSSDKLQKYNEWLVQAKDNLSFIESLDIFSAIPIFTYLKFLNKWAKQSDFPIAKHAFYSFKQDIIEYFLLQNNPDIKWEINPEIEEQKISDGESIYLCQVHLDIFGRKYIFHQKLEGIIAAIAWPFLNKENVIPYEKINDLSYLQNAIVSNKELIEVWKNLLTICERYNWFLYHHKSAYDFVLNLNNRYNNLVIQIKNLDRNIGFNKRIQIIVPFRINQLRKSFYDIRNKYNLMLELNLHLKQDIDEIETIYLKEFI